MGNRSINQWGKAALLCVASSIALVGASGAMAQSAGAQQEVQRINLPAGPLARTLVELGDSLGVDILAEESLVVDQTAPAISGAFTTEQAIDQALAGSGLVARPSSSGAFIIAQQAARARPESTVEPQGPLVTDTIVVTGLRAERSSTALNTDAALVETPATVNIITRDFIDAIQPRTLEEILQYTPGVSAGNQNGTGSEFNIRGFSATTIGSNGGQPVFVDDYRGPGLRYNFDTELYDRIEFLKGTSGILYGVAPPGGIVRFVTRRPTFESEHRVEAEIGSFDRSRFTLDSTASINESETLAYRLIATVSSFNQTPSGTSDDVSFDDRVIIKPSLSWLTPTGGEAYLSYEYNDYENNYDPGIPVLPDGTFAFRNAPLTGEDGVLNNTHHIGTAEYTQPVAGDWEIFIGGQYGFTNGSSVWNTSFQDRGGDPNLFAIFQRIRSSQDNEYYDIRGEVRGSFYTGSNIKHDIVIGANSYRSERRVDGERIRIVPDLIDPLNPVFPAVELTPSDNQVTLVDKSTQVYLQNYVSIGDYLKLFGGVSWIDASSTFEEVRSGALFREREGEDNAVDWSAGAILNINSWINPFVSYSTSLAPQQGLLANGEPIPFQEGEQIEVGWKSELFNNRALLTVSVFEISQSNQAEADPTNPNFRVLIGDQRTRGFEAELVGNVTENFDLYASYSYLDAEFTGGTGANVGNTPQDVPTHKASLLANYSFSRPLEGWRVGGGIIHVGERQGNNGNTFQLPSFERVDLTLAYDSGPIGFRATVENILDTDYVQGSGLGAFGNTVVQGAPRFFTLSAEYRF